jgi:hypothetical protein
MESSDIDEDWVRANFNPAKERKTMTRVISKTVDIDEWSFGYGTVEYNKFFDILKNFVDAHILQLIVKENITCAEKDINIELEMTTSNWYGDAESSICIFIEWVHRETIAEVIKRLISSNKRALTALKRKTKKQNKLADQIKKMSSADRNELKRLL